MTTLTATNQSFASTFKDEHRAVRDLLFDLMGAFQSHDQAEALRIVGDIAAATGPHFRYEEESLYPNLVPVFGVEYIRSLIGDHDNAIASAEKLVALASKPELGSDEITTAVTLARGILPHVSDCDGLSIMVERLPDADVDEVFDARARAQAEGLDLLTWAKTVRTPPQLADA